MPYYLALGGICYAREPGANDRWAILDTGKTACKIWPRLDVNRTKEACSETWLKSLLETARWVVMQNVWRKRSEAAETGREGNYTPSAWHMASFTSGCLLLLGPLWFVIDLHGQPELIHFELRLEMREGKFFLWFYNWFYLA